MIQRRKIKDIDDAIFAIKLILKIYKKTTPNVAEIKNLIQYYKDALKATQKNFHSTDLSLFKISSKWASFEFKDANQYKEFKKELISKCEALKDFLESKIEKNNSEEKTIEKRVENLEKMIKKFDERLDYVVSELGTLKNVKKELKKDRKQNTKNKI